MILSVNLCWVMTTPPPLRSARTALFVLVVLGLLLEKFLCEEVSVFGSHSDAVVLVRPVPWRVVFLPHEAATQGYE